MKNSFLNEMATDFKKNMTVGSVGRFFLDMFLGLLLLLIVDGIVYICGYDSGKVFFEDIMKSIGCFIYLFLLYSNGYIIYLKVTKTKFPYHWSFGYKTAIMLFSIPIHIITLIDELVAMSKDKEFKKELDELEKTLK